MTVGRRRIKIICSDFHLGTGRLALDGAVDEMEDFVSDRAFCDLLEFYRTGEFVDAEVELVLNGDTFELLGLVAPGEVEPEVITEAMSLARIKRVLEGHPDLCGALRSFAAAEHRSVTLMVGNHDQDLLWAEVQQLLREWIGPNLRVLSEPYLFDGVHVEHGSQHDVHNRFDPDDWSMVHEDGRRMLRLPWGSDFFISCMLRIKQLRPYANRVRPFRIALRWSLFNDFGVVWRGIWYLISAIFSARFRRPPARRISLWTSLRMVFGMSPYDNLEQAAERLLAQNKSLNTVIFGHSHLPLTRCVTPGRGYLNTGAWIPTSNLHISAIGSSLSQIYAYVEYVDGRPRCCLKLWHGRHSVEEDILLGA